MNSVRGGWYSHGGLDLQAFSVSGKWQIAVAVLDNLIRRGHEKFQQGFKGCLWLITFNVHPCSSYRVERTFKDGGH